MNELMGQAAALVTILATVVSMMVWGVKYITRQIGARATVAEEGKDAAADRFITYLEHRAEKADAIQERLSSAIDSLAENAKEQSAHLAELRKDIPHVCKHPQRARVRKTQA